MANTKKLSPWLQRAIESEFLPPKPTQNSSSISQTGSMGVVPRDFEQNYTRAPKDALAPLQDPSYTVREIEMIDPSYTLAGSMGEQGSLNPNFGMFGADKKMTNSSFGSPNNYGSSQSTAKTGETAEEWANRQDLEAANASMAQEELSNKKLELANMAQQIAQYPPEYTRQRIDEQSAEAQQRAMERGFNESEPTEQYNNDNIGYTAQPNNPLVSAAQYASQNQGSNNSSANNYGGTSDFKIDSAPKPNTNNPTVYTGKPVVKDENGTFHYNDFGDFLKYIGTKEEYRPKPVSGTGDEYKKNLNMDELTKGKFQLDDRK